MINNKLTSEELIRLIEEFRIEQPGEKLTAASLGRYLRTKGYNIEDYTIRRRPGVKEYIDKCNSEDEKVHIKKVAVFRTLDVDSFLENNKTRNKLKSALIERDKYYAEQSASAAAAFKENKNLKQQIKDLQAANKKLKEKAEKKKAREERAITKEKDDVIKKLKAIIDEYISEQMANKILEEEGILETVSSISDQTYEEHMITPETDIRKFKNRSVSKLWENLDD